MLTHTHTHTHTHTQWLKLNFHNKISVLLFVPLYEAAGFKQPLIPPSKRLMNTESPKNTEEEVTSHAVRGGREGEKEGAGMRRKGKVRGVIKRNIKT